MCIKVDNIYQHFKIKLKIQEPQGESTKGTEIELLKALRGRGMETEYPLFR